MWAVGCLLCALVGLVQAGDQPPVGLAPNSSFPFLSSRIDDATSGDARDGYRVDTFTTTNWVAEPFTGPDGTCTGCQRSICLWDTVNDAPANPPIPTIDGLNANCISSGSLAAQCTTCSPAPCTPVCTFETPTGGHQSMQLNLQDGPGFASNAYTAVELTYDFGDQPISNVWDYGDALYLDLTGLTTSAQSQFAHIKLLQVEFTTASGTHLLNLQTQYTSPGLVMRNWADIDSTYYNAQPVIIPFALWAADQRIPELAVEKLRIRFGAIEGHQMDISGVSIRPYWTSLSYVSDLGTGNFRLNVEVRRTVTTETGIGVYNGGALIAETIRLQLDPDSCPDFTLVQNTARQDGVLITGTYAGPTVTQVGSYEAELTFPIGGKETEFTVDIVPPDTFKPYIRCAVRVHDTHLRYDEAFDNGPWRPLYVRDRYTQFCGDGRKTGSEYCDDANSDNADQCTDKCLRPRWLKGYDTEEELYDGTYTPQYAHPDYGTPFAPINADELLCTRLQINPQLQGFEVEWAGVWNMEGDSTVYGSSTNLTWGRFALYSRYDDGDSDDQNDRPADLIAYSGTFQLNVNATEVAFDPTVAKCPMIGCYLCVVLDKATYIAKRVSGGTTGNTPVVAHHINSAFANVYPDTNPSRHNTRYYMWVRGQALETHTPTATSTRSASATPTLTSSPSPTNTYTYSGTSSRTKTPTPTPDPTLTRSLGHYTYVGIPQAIPTMATHWVDLSPSTGIVNEPMTVTLQGLHFIHREYTVYAKIARGKGFDDCYDHHEGGSPRSVNKNGTVEFMLPSIPADYRVCWMYRKDWEPVSTYLTVTDPVWDEVYYGYSSCQALVAANASVCGCWYGSNHTQMHIQVNMSFSRADLLNTAHDMWVINQGCCTDYSANRNMEHSMTHPTVTGDSRADWGWCKNPSE